MRGQFWWWIEEWRDSEACHSMNAEQRGLHRSLIDIVVGEEDGLPFDPAQLRSSTNCTAAEWLRAWPVVQKFWDIRSGRIYLGDEARTYVTPAYRDKHGVRVLHMPRNVMPLIPMWEL